MLFEENKSKPLSFSYKKFKEAEHLSFPLALDVNELASTFSKWDPNFYIVGTKLQLPWDELGG